MRRRMLAVLPMLLCLLCACGGGENQPMQAPMSFRAGLTEGTSCRFVAEGTAEVEERIYALTLACSCAADGTVRVRVCAPETIAGVEAEIDGSTGTLHFDDLYLTFGLPDDERLAPAAMPAVLLRAWREGYIVSAGPEADGVLAVYDFGPEDPVTVRTRFDAEGLPAEAELFWMNRACGRFAITDFEYTSGGNHEAAKEDLG